MKTVTSYFSANQMDSLLLSFSQATKRLVNSVLLLGNFGGFQKSADGTNFSSRMNMQQFKRNFKKNYIVLLPIAVVFVVILVLIGNFFSKDSASGSVQGAQDNRTKMNNALAVEELDKRYTFTLSDAAGKPLKVTFEIQDVELRDQIVLRGQPVTAVQGRVFLIANLKIVNDSTVNVGMMTKDYLRLTVDGGSDKLAPEIHNDPVQVQAISTKLTRVGFAIDDTAKKLVLQIGEIDGKKDTIELHLQE